MDYNTPNSPCQKHPFPWGPAPPSNTPMPGPTPFTTPNGSLIASCTFAQLCHKVPNGYNWMPNIHPQNCPFPWGNLHPFYLPHPWSQLTHHPKRHPDPISHFSTIHRTVRLTGWYTHRPTDGPGNKTCTNIHLCYIDYTATWLIIINRK